MALRGPTGRIASKDALAMIGVDFGGTYIKVADVEGGAIVRTASVPTPKHGDPGAVLDALAEAVFSLDPAPHELGVAIPGQVDSTGTCIRLPNVPGFEGVPIRDEISYRLGGARVAVENDATVAALGELHHGHGERYDSFLVVTLGTGVGGGLVVHRGLVRGRTGFAAEIGHLPIDTRDDAWPCGCGKRGCVESYAGTAGLLRRHAELGGSATTPAAVAALARQGEPAALETFGSVGRALGDMLRIVQNLLDLDAIVFSGGISASLDLVEPAMRARLQAQVHGPPLGTVPFAVSALGDKAGLVGAAHLAARG